MYVDPSGELLIEYAEVRVVLAFLVLVVGSILLITATASLPKPQSNTLSGIKTLDDVKIESKEEEITVSPPSDGTDIQVSF